MIDEKQKKIQKNIKDREYRAKNKKILLDKLNKKREKIKKIDKNFISKYNTTFSKVKRMKKKIEDFELIKQNYLIKYLKIFFSNNEKTMENLYKHFENKKKSFVVFLIENKLFDRKKASKLEIKKHHNELVSLKMKYRRMFKIINKANQRMPKRLNTATKKIIKNYDKMELKTSEKLNKYLIEQQQIKEKYVKIMKEIM